jgi:hypothetical protein
MLLIDDLLKAPFSGLMFVLREVAKAADAELEAEDGRVLAQLSDLHRRLDAGDVGETEFDQQERVLLDKLDDLRGREKSDDATPDGHPDEHA